MRTTIRATMLVCLAGAAVLFTGCGNDKKKIEGKWEVTSVDAPFDQLVEETLTFAAALSGKEITPEQKAEKLAQMKKEMEAEYKKIEIEVKGTAVTINGTGAKKTPTATISMNPDKSPKEIDLTPDEEKGGKDEEKGGKKETLKGIYKLDGDTLTVAFGVGDDAPRPTEFKSSFNKGDKGKGGMVLVVTLKRKK